MPEREYKGEYTEVILNSIEVGDRTEAQLVGERERQERFGGSESILQSMDEALTVLQEQS